MRQSIQEPLFILWFGNFYRPAYDDKAFVDDAMARIRKMGFNAVMLDSKAWEDFALRFAGGEASPYVSQQEYMMEAARRAGLGHLFLSLYCNGDNLYPAIRFSPPIHGESITRPDGADGRWYKYWSPKAQQAQQNHVSGLLALYESGHAEFTLDGEKRLPMCSMWDPIVMPSFDPEGQSRYVSWLKKRYSGLDALNAAYETRFERWEDIALEQVWFSQVYQKEAPDAEDVARRSPAFAMWADQQFWRAQELAAYFSSMRERLRQVDPRLYLMPDLSQWGHFLNVWTVRKGDVRYCENWDTATRGIDMKAIAPFVDMCHYYTVPVTFDGDPDAYAVSCQHAHIRSLNPGRPFLGGRYWGRYLYNDLYRYLTPEEIVGGIVASGAGGLAAYGFCGMDDGGILHKMDEGFLSSLTRANEWAKRVIPQLGKRKKSRVALLFPAAMALLEPLTVEGAAEKRSDLLGLFHLCCDWGWSPDIVEEEEVSADLTGYDALLVPSDDCYFARRSPRMEAAMRDYVEKGGVIIHGRHGQSAALAFSLEGGETRGACYTYRGEGGLLLKEDFVSFPGQPLALWREDGKPCVSRTAYGAGYVYSFGFQPGFQACARSSPHVPSSQRNNALYPFTHMEHNVLRDILEKHARKDVAWAQKDVEWAAFERGWIAVNHRSTPVTLPIQAPCDAQQPLCAGALPAHSAAFLLKKD